MIKNDDRTAISLKALNSMPLKNLTDQPTSLIDTQMSRSTEFICNTMSLREPLKQSLGVLENLITQNELLGDNELAIKESQVKENYRLFEEFERNFPSVCFSIATGIGKTRLMGAFVTWLVKEKGIKNFVTNQFLL